MAERGETPHPARLLISSSRKPVSYINLAKRFLQEHGEVQLSALGVAISSMVTLAEILKNKQLAVEMRVMTSLEEIASDSRTRHKPKMSVTLGKSPQFDDIIAAEGARAFAQDGADGVVADGPPSGNGGVHHLRGGNANGHAGRSGSSHGGGPAAEPRCSYSGGGGASSAPPPYGADGPLHQPHQYGPQDGYHDGYGSYAASGSVHRSPYSAATGQMLSRDQQQYVGLGPLPSQFSAAGRGSPLPHLRGGDVLPPPLPLQGQPPGSQHPYLQQQLLAQHLLEQQIANLQQMGHAPPQQHQQQAPPSLQQGGPPGKQQPTQLQLADLMAGLQMNAAPQQQQAPLPS